MTSTPWYNHHHTAGAVGEAFAEFVQDVLDDRVSSAVAQSLPLDRVVSLCESLHERHVAGRAVYGLWCRLIEGASDSVARCSVFSKTVRAIAARGDWATAADAAMRWAAVAGLTDPAAADEVRCPACALRHLLAECSCATGFPERKKKKVTKEILAHTPSHSVYELKNCEHN